MRDLIEKYGLWGSAVVVVAISGWFTVTNVTDYLVTQAQAAEERSDNARLHLENTLTRINDTELEKIRTANRTDLEEDVKIEFIGKLDRELDRLERRAECLEEVVETKEHRKC